VAHRARSRLRPPPAREGLNPDPQGGRLTTYPRCFSHIGISVTDLEQAVEFYSKALGFYVIMPPTTIRHDDSAIGQMCDDVFGEGWGSFRIAHLSTGEGIGVELFEFRNGERRADNFEYWKTGIFHFCVKDPDVEGLVKRIEEHGGRQRMKQVRYYYPGQKPYRMVYCEDPFGNIIEIYSHSYELTYSAGAYV
jgi:lactoylglutathione lyase family protein